MGRTKKDKSSLIAIGVRLEKAQKNAKLTNVEIARALDVTTQSLIAYKHGKTEISYEKAMKFAELTNTNVLDYLTQDGKTALLHDKVESETTKNGVLFDYLNSLGLLCDVQAQQNHSKSSGNDDDMKTWFGVVPIEYMVYLEKKDRYDRATDPQEKEFYRDSLALLKYKKAQEIPSAVFSKKEWDDMKKDIDKAVRDVVSKHIKNHLKKLEAQRLQTKIKTLALDISPQDPEKLKSVCDGLQGAINDFIQKF